MLCVSLAAFAFVTWEPLSDKKPFLNNFPKGFLVEMKVFLLKYRYFTKSLGSVVLKKIIPFEQPVEGALNEITSLLHWIAQAATIIELGWSPCWDWDFVRGESVNECVLVSSVDGALQRDARGCDDSLRFWLRMLPFWPQTPNCSNVKAQVTLVVISIPEYPWPWRRLSSFWNVIYPLWWGGGGGQQQMYPVTLKGRYP